MAKPRKPGDYSVSGQGITDPMVKVGNRPGTSPPGTPIAVMSDKTPVQPIMINVPAPQRGDKTIDIWHLIAAIVIAVVVSGIVSVAVAIAFRTESLDKIDKVERRVDGVDGQIRALDTKTTRIEARMDNDR